jgi:ribosomal protein L37AE/L43A
MWREQGPRYSANPIRDVFDAAAHGYNLKLTCRGCRRAEVLHSAAVWHLFQRKRWRDLMSDLSGHFRCGGCGRKDPKVDLSHDLPTSTELPMPWESEWKRELRRRR